MFCDRNSKKIKVKMTSTVVTTDFSTEEKIKEAYDKLNEEEVGLPVNAHNSVTASIKRKNLVLLL